MILIFIIHLSLIIITYPLLTTILPGTSDESKQHSREVLDNEFNGGDVAGSGKSEDDKNPNNVYVYSKTIARLTNINLMLMFPVDSAGGLKATMNNPQVSQEAKDSAKERLEGMN